LKPLDRFERARIKALSEGVPEQKQRHLEQMTICWELSAIPLQRAEIVGVAEFSPTLFEDVPVALFMLRAQCRAHVAAKIRRHRIVVQQRVVDVEQEHDID
jgi:hypothetical protein